MPPFQKFCISKIVTPSKYLNCLYSNSLCCTALHILFHIHLSIYVHPYFSHVRQHVHTEMLINTYAQVNTKLYNAPVFPSFPWGRAQSYKYIQALPYHLRKALNNSASMHLPFLLDKFGLPLCFSLPVLLWSFPILSLAHITNLSWNILRLPPQKYPPLLFRTQALAAISHTECMFQITATVLQVPVNHRCKSVL